MTTPPQSAHSHTHAGTAPRPGPPPTDHPALGAARCIVAGHGNAAASDRPAGARCHGTKACGGSAARGTTGKRAQERRERAEQKGGTSTAHHPLLPPSLARCAAAGRVGGRVAAGPPGRPRGGVMSLDGGPVAARRPALHPFPLLSGVEKRQTPVRDRPVETGSRRRCDYLSRGGTRTLPPPALPRSPATAPSADIPTMPGAWVAAETSARHQRATIPLLPPQRLTPAAGPALHCRSRPGSLRTCTGRVRVGTTVPNPQT